jgi:hypothetical protein
VFETFSEIQQKDKSKAKLISCYQNRRVISSIIKDIEVFDWASVAKQSPREEKFEFQIHKSNSTENCLKAEELEERLRAHYSLYM